MDKQRIVDEFGQTAVAGMDLFQWFVVQMMRSPIFFIGLVGLLVVQNNKIKVKLGKLLDVQL